MTWQHELQGGFHSPRTLLNFLELDEKGFSIAADKQFQTRVPLSFAKRMIKGNSNCPLLRQVLPIADEELETEGFSLDPLSEREFNATPGMLHKYHGRVLVMLATSCAINCRYCFRRHFPYQDNRVGRRQWLEILDYIATREDIHEVILSGGDPLMHSNHKLREFLERLTEIKHVETVRFHTRLPVVIPSRIDDDFIKLLASSRLKAVMVYHINHHQELCDEIKLGVDALRRHQVVVLNQAVLLSGVNDSEDVLVNLSHALWRHGILPYYLHLLDKTQHTSHFEIKKEKALLLFKAMQSKLPGYLVPKLVREDSYQKSKTWIF